MATHNYKLASHDTMTYLKPNEWYLIPFKFMAQCQNKTIKEQYEKYGIRYFDLRVKFNKKGKPVFAHGAMTFKGDVYDTLKYLNSKGEEVWVRMLLEVGSYDYKQEALFVEFCKNIVMNYPNLKFHNGRRKYDWQIVYQFPNPEPSLDQKVSSMTWKVLDDWCPYIYAKAMNKKNLEAGTDKDYLMIDFVGTV